MTVPRRRLMTALRRWEPPADAADCCRLGPAAKADLAQQPPKIIPAVAADKSLRKPLRVGMVAFLFAFHRLRAGGFLPGNTMADRRIKKLPGCGTPPLP